MSDLSPHTAIHVEDLGKCFKFYPSNWQRVRGALFKSGNHAQEVWALRHVNLCLPRGATLGVIGQNGSGKTTLLQVISGLLKPTEGNVEVQGSLATLLELGAGFQPEFTGRENIFVSGGLIGFSRREIEMNVDQIIAFSELSEFIDRPIKHYSTGMLMRLAFATAISVQPDILLIDEVFAVGDTAFQHKCIHRFRELQKRGITVVLVSHDLTAVKSFCSQAVLLDHGRQIKFGNAEEVTSFYLDLLSQKYAGQESPSDFPQEPAPSLQPLKTEFLTEMKPTPSMHRFGTGEGRICAVQVLNASRAPSEILVFGEEATFRFYLEYLADVARSGLGFYIRDRYGNDLIGINTFEEGKDLGSHKIGDRLIVDFRLPLHLAPGNYSVSPGFSYHRSEMRFLDWIDNAAFFEMQAPASGQKIHGLVYVPNHVSVWVANDE